MQRDTTALVKAVAAVVREQIAKAVQSLSTRLDGVEQRFAELPEPKDGNDGKSVTVEDVAPLIEQAVSKAVAAVPVPKDGIDGKDGEAGRDGVGKDGRDGKDGKDGAPGERGETGPAGLPGERGADGLPGKDGRDGAPGQAGERGLQGERGVPGVDGKSITMDDVSPIIEAAIAKGMLELERRGMDQIQRCIDRIEKPKDGAPGKDGRDAFDLEDIHAELADDGRTLTLAWVRGEARVERQLTLPHVIYRGVHQQAKQYQRGDSVTFQGSTWIAMRDTSSKPETDDSWRLAVKRGRDGKDGQKGDKGDRGAPGKSEQR